MANESEDELASLSDEERTKRALELTQEVANRYDPDKLAKIVIAEAGRGERLDDATRHKMERVLGGRFADVRIFKGEFADAVTRRHGADAVTVANTGMILVREGSRRANPATPEGQALLAHELTHVRQAQKGLHFALEGGGGQGAAHEREAEGVEQRVLQAEHGGQKPGDDPRERRRRIVERALELYLHWQRDDAERNGMG
jgi:hypothetical protein